MTFKPGATIKPARPNTATQTTHAGKVIIQPPAHFAVLRGVMPRPVANASSVPGRWGSETQADGSTVWTCTIDTNTVFAETEYSVLLNVVNSPLKGSALSWTIDVVDAQQPFPEILATSANVRGFPILGHMVSSVAAENQLSRQLNRVEISFTPSTNLGSDPHGMLYITAPPGVVIYKRCPGLVLTRLRHCTCKGSDANTAVLTFPEGNSIMQGETYSFFMEVVNPDEAFVEVDNNVEEKLGEQNFQVFSEMRILAKIRLVILDFVGSLC